MWRVDTVSHEQRIRADRRRRRWFTRCTQRRQMGGSRSCLRAGQALASAESEVTKAERAIRSDSAGSPRDAGVISVVLDDDPDNDVVVHLAMEEGRLREATVRQVDRRLNSWVRRFPDVHVEMVAAGSGRSYLESHQDRHSVQLAVVSQADADRITEFEVPNYHPIVGFPDCSVLLVRH